MKQTGHFLRSSLTSSFHFSRAYSNWSMCVCVCVRACVRSCVRAWVCVCVCMRVLCACYLMAVCLVSLPFLLCRHSATKGIVIAMICTFFEAFNVPVFWPILVMYFIMLFCITMKRQIKV